MVSFQLPQALFAELWGGGQKGERQPSNEARWHIPSIRKELNTSDCATGAASQDASQEGSQTAASQAAASQTAANQAASSQAESQAEAQAEAQAGGDGVGPASGIRKGSGDTCHSLIENPRSTLKRRAPCAIEEGDMRLKLPRQFSELRGGEHFIDPRSSFCAKQSQAVFGVEKLAIFKESRGLG